MEDGPRTISGIVATQHASQRRQARQDLGTALDSLDQALETTHRAQRRALKMTWVAVGLQLAVLVLLAVSLLF